MSDWLAPGVYFRSVIHHLPTVGLSLVIAVLASYVALDFAGRVRGSVDRMSGQLWMVAGAAAMGTGVWSMHFVGMSAVTWPFEARFTPVPTMFSWVVAMLVAYIPVCAASHAPIERRSRYAYAVSTSAGVAAMHFLGVVALSTSPPPVYSVPWLAAGVVTAAIGSGLALTIAGRDRPGLGTARLRSHVGAAVVFGLSLTLLHYLAMASANFSPDAVCTSRDGFEARVLGSSVGAVTLAFLALMLLVSTLEKRSQRVAAELGASLDKARDALHYVTFNDAVTGLPNRLVFQQRLRQSMEQGERTGRSLAVLVVEIDDFVRLERGQAPDAVARLVRQFGQRLVTAAGESSVACAGGPQFLILTPSFANADPQPALEIAERINEAMRVPFESGSAGTRLGASVGIAVAPSDGGTDKIVGSAGVALQAARAAGGNGFAFFESEMDSGAQVTADLLEHLRLAVERGQFELHYQPKVIAFSGQIEGVEALLRWRHPDKGPISPAVFVPLAERFGLINDIGRWVLDEAARQMAEWGGMGIRLRVAVNVSAVQLRQPNFDVQVTDALARHAVDPSLLTCEITESEAMRNSDATLAVFRRLQSIGVGLSIDDFGTGYSSLAQLRRMPVRQLKIDRSFVADLPGDADALAVVKAIVDLAHALRLEVVAEGVETAAQRDVLRDIGCDKFQGYFFARPMPAATLSQMLCDTQDPRLQFRESVFVG